MSTAGGKIDESTIVKLEKQKHENTGGRNPDRKGEWEMNQELSANGERNCFSAKSGMGTIVVNSFLWVV